MILRYNFFLQNNRLCFGIQIPLSRVYARFNSFDISGAFTFCAWSNTGTVQSYSIPEKCDDIRFLSVFIDWYTFQLQEVRKRFFCFRKKKFTGRTGQNHLLRFNGHTWTISLPKYIMQRYSYLFNLNSDANRPNRG